MKEAEFRAWLEARRFNGKPLTTVSNRMAQARWFEKQMASLGLADDLDTAFDQDSLAGASTALKQLIKQADAKQPLPDGIMSGSSNPAQRLRNVASAVRNYRDFRSGKSTAGYSDWPELDQMREAFLDRVPEFERFSATDNAYEQVERAYKDVMIEQVRAICASADNDMAAGRRIYKALMPQSGPLLRWQTADAVDKKTPQLADRFYGEIGRLARSSSEPAEGIFAAAEHFSALRTEGATVLTAGQSSKIAFTVVGMARPAASAPFQATTAREAAMLLTGDKIFDLNGVTLPQVEKWLGLLKRVFAVMRDQWDWQPRDLIDVQGFLWTALSEDWVEAEESAENTAPGDDDWITLFDAAGGQYRPRRERNQQTGDRAYRIKPAGASNETAEAIETNDAVEVARALILEGRPVRIVALGAPTANYLKYPGKLISYRLSPDIAVALGVPADTTGTASNLTDEAILRKFDAVDPRFGKARVEWSAATTSAFCELARAVHGAGYDWWMVDRQSHYECRFGRKTPGQKTAFAVLGYVSGRQPWLGANTKSGLGEYIGEQAIVDTTATALSTVLQDRRSDLEKWTGEQPARPGCWPDAYRMESTDTLESEKQPMPGERAATAPLPTNLILYGPPGTGKTYATAREAVRLCGEAVPDDRKKLMASYNRLAEAGRIEFVTFHQSYSYEDFVEGLRPVQGDDGAAGFHLQPEPGVFRRIARRAETSTGSGHAAFAIGDRQVFKMSIGRANEPDDAYLFEEAIGQGYALLGFDNLDWSDPCYAKRDQIIAKLAADGEGGDEITPYAGRVQSPDMFRNWMKKGDLIVVSKGNSLFRAIGEVTGDYEFRPRPEEQYAHRRGVRWLWVDPAGVPVEEIYSAKFSQRTIYLLTKSELNIPALERYVESQRGGRGAAPDQFVLIVDEINRANISKVMGELITLIEPDKRLSTANELRLRLPYSRDMFGVPANLHIIGTMNTADRSIALLDTALRRRFRFQEVAPDPALLGESAAITGIPLPAFLRTINDRIEYLLDREHRIGHAFFINCGTAEDVHVAMRDAVIPLLQEYFFEDWSRVAAVLGEGKKGGNFLACREIRDPHGEGEARQSWSVLKEFAADAYQRCIDGPSKLALVQPEAEAAE